MDAELKMELSRQGIFTTTLEELYNWGRKSSVWPLTFGLACCAIEMIATTHGSVRSGAVWRGGFSAFAAAGGSDDRRRDGDEEDGPAGGAAL